MVISLHHAPETYGIRRKSKKDANKYLAHLYKIGVLNKNDYQLELTKSKESLKNTKNLVELPMGDDSSKDRANKTNSLSPASWNKQVSDALKQIYSRLDENIVRNIIATQSGHDHYSGILIKKNAPIAIIQGNGAQEGLRSTLADPKGKQKINNQFASEEKNKK